VLSYLAATSHHSALPIVSCGLKLDDEAVGWLLAYAWASTSAPRINAAAEHQLTPVACTVLSVSRHRAKLLDTTLLTTWLPRQFAAAGIPVCKEPTGLSRTDGKRPDGMTLISWWAGKPAVWDVTVVCTSAGSYLNSTAREAGAAAEFAASRKTAKYVSLAASHLLFPIADETQGTLNEEARQLLCDFYKLSCTQYRFFAV